MLLLALAVVASEARANESCEKKSLGKGVTLSESTPIAVILDRADEFVGKPVRVEGTVTEVCETAGCWMELRAGEMDRTLRVKVRDGEIVFPVAARGRQATAEGTVEAIEMTRERYLDYQHHLADEAGRTFDETSVGEGPYRVLQVKGTGAELCL